MNQSITSQSCLASTLGSELGQYNVVDINRLIKLKQQQEDALKVIRTRINHLEVTEKKTWNDIERNRKELEKQEDARDRYLVKKEQQIRRSKTQDIELRRLKNSIQSDRERTKSQQKRAIQKSKQDKLSMSEEVRLIKDKTRRESERNSMNRLQHNIQLKEQIKSSAQQQKLFQQFLKQQREQEVQAEKALQFAELEEAIRELQKQLYIAEQDELEAIARLRDTQILQQKSAASTTIGSRSSTASKFSTSTASSCRVRAMSARGSRLDGILTTRSNGAAPPRVGRPQCTMVGSMRRNSSSNLYTNIRPLSARLHEQRDLEFPKTEQPEIHLSMLEAADLKCPEAEIRKPVCAKPVEQVSQAGNEGNEENQTDTVATNC